MFEMVTGKGFRREDRRAMKTFTENEKIPGLPFIPTKLLCESSWGEIWRATHEFHRDVIFVAYSGREGEELFAASEVNLRKWESYSTSLGHHLLRILTVSDSAIPYILTEDPGDRTLSESMEHHHGRLTLEGIAKVVRDIALGLTEAENWDMTPLGIAPELIFRSHDEAGSMWRILPVAPLVTPFQRSVFCGRYLPQSSADGQAIDCVNADVYSLGVIWMELIKVYVQEASEREKRLLSESGLKEVLSTCMQKVEGDYRSPQEMVERIQGWMTKFHRRKDEIVSRIAAEVPEVGAERRTTPPAAKKPSGDAIASKPDDPVPMDIPQDSPLSVNDEATVLNPAKGWIIPPTGPAGTDPSMDAEQTIRLGATPDDPEKTEILGAEPPRPSAPAPPVVRTPEAVASPPRASDRGKREWEPPEGYEIVEQLGAGSMSRVYKAIQKNLDRVVVLKVSQAVAGMGIEDNPQRLLLEAKTIAKLEHENIVGIYDCLTHLNSVHLIMEYVEGQTLGDLLKKKKLEDVPSPQRRFFAAPGRLKPGKVVDIGIHAARALEYAHRHKVIHRDVKPSNLLLTADGHAKLFDFSIAKVEMGESITASGMILGSPAYMSPEQVERLPLDGRSDIYALGCVLYHCLVGRPPFQDKSDVVLCLKHLKEDAPPPDTLVPGIPEELSHIVMRCLYKDRVNRFPTAKDLEFALTECLDKLVRSDKRRPAKPAETIDPLRASRIRIPGVPKESLRRVEQSQTEKNVVIFIVVFLAAMTVGVILFFW